MIRKQSKNDINAPPPPPAVAAIATKPQTATPILPPWLPLLKQWQQQRQQEVAILRQGSDAFFCLEQIMIWD
jgi:hypothetical protein